MAMWTWKQLRLGFRLSCWHLLRLQLHCLGRHLARSQAYRTKLQGLEGTTTALTRAASLAPTM